MTQARKVIQTTEANFFPVFTRSNLVVERAEGCRVWDVDGKEYLDLTAGWGVTCLGHSHPALVAAISRQAALCMQAPNCNLSYTPVQAEAAERLIRAAPDGMTRAFFTNSGSEATEGAIKLVRRALAKPGIIATKGGFHGRTLGAASITSGERYRVPFEPVLPGAKFVEYGSGDAVRAAIDADTAAVIVEPVQGEGGVNVPPDGYLSELREIADRTGLLLIFDEIQTGVGRTGAMFAANHENVTPDILLLGKCLGSGFPVGAIVVTERVSDTIQKGDHGGTYSGNPLACAAVTAVLREMTTTSILENSRSAGKFTMDFLNELRRSAPEILANVRGKGLLIGCEMASADIASDVAEECLRRGVVLNTVQGKVIRIFPALNIELPLLRQGLETLRDVILRV